MVVLGTDAHKRIGASSGDGEPRSESVDAFVDLGGVVAKTDSCESGFVGFASQGGHPAWIVVYSCYRPTPGWTESSSQYQPVSLDDWNLEWAPHPSRRFKQEATASPYRLRSQGSLQRFGEFLGWCHPVEGLSRSAVELMSGEVEVVLGECCHVGAFG